jgi:uncharacterized protein (TIGR02569 family)
MEPVATDGDVPPSAPGLAALPGHVRSAFGVREVPAEPLRIAGVPGWRCGDVLLRPVADHVRTAWASGVLDTLRVDGVRIARPIRSSDGRWVVAGHSACQFVEGVPRPRYDELIEASLRLHAATASVQRPRLLDDRDDMMSRADAMAWGDRVIQLDAGAGGALFDELAPFREELDLPAQVVHGDLFGTVLFADGQPPAVLDLVPFWRPVEYAAAVIVVDALAWGGGEGELVSDWSHLDGWPQVLLRALLFRIALHAQHPASSPESLHGLRRSAQVIADRL